jgi:hypothetical protein
MGKFSLFRSLGKKFVGPGVMSYGKKFVKNPVRGVTLGANAYHSKETRERRIEKNVKYLTGPMSAIVPGSGRFLEPAAKIVNSAYN